MHRSHDNRLIPTTLALFLLEKSACI